MFLEVIIKETVSLTFHSFLFDSNEKCKQIFPEIFFCNRLVPLELESYGFRIYKNLYCERLVIF